MSCCKSGICKWIGAASFVGIAALASVTVAGCDKQEASSTTKTTTTTDTPAGTVKTTETHEKKVETNPK